MLIRASKILGTVLALVCVMASATAAWAQVAVVDQSTTERGDGYELTIAYPRIGISAADGAMQSFADDLASGFKQAVSQRQPQEPSYSAQLSYSVARNDEDVVSVLFTYSIYTGGAHPNLQQAAFNFLLPDGARVFLPDLIGEDGITRVSDLAIADLTSRLTGPDGMSDPRWIQTGAGPYADNFETFEYLPDQIVLEFDPYGVAAYAAGPQEVRIPDEQLQGLWRPDPRAPLPSFDCTAAETRVENAICSDMQLAQLDRRTAEAFNARLRDEATTGQPPTVRAQQQAWLATRDAACGGFADDDALVACLVGEYRARLVALRTYQD